MKVCKNGLNNIWINHANGEVRICGWTGYVIGNLVDNTIEELWNNDRAQAFRKSMLDGSYRFCDRKECPYCANGELDLLQVDYEVANYPKFCSLSYEQSCNYVCKACRLDHYTPCSCEAEYKKKIEKEVLKFIDKLDTVSANGVGELFCSPSAMQILSQIKSETEMKVYLESNGSLFNKDNWEKIRNLGEHDLKVTITVHSFHEDTYQFLSGTTLPISNIIDNLKFVSSLRKQGIINELELATVICERNFREMPEFVEYALREFELDKIRLRFYKPYIVRPLAIEWFFDVRNPEHPYYEEFVKVMQNPVFDNPKVWKWQGDTLSDLKEHPYFVEKKKNEMISVILGDDSIGDRMVDFLEGQGIHTIALYGFGVMCKALITALKEHNEIIEQILDTYADTKEVSMYRGYGISKPTYNALNCDAVVITTVINCEKIASNLSDLNYKGKVITVENLINEITDCKYGK